MIRGLTVPKPQPPAKVGTAPGKITLLRCTKKLVVELPRGPGSAFAEGDFPESEDTKGGHRSSESWDITWGEVFSTAR